MPNGTWKIARGKGAQLPLAIVAVLAVVLVLIGKAQSSLFDRARADFSDWTAPALEAVRAPMNGISRWVSGLGGIFVVYDENLRLKEENARLRQWQSAALLLDERLKRYQLLLNAVPDPSLSSVTAHVIGRASRPFLDTMILDAGKKSGVHPGQAVVDPRGMIGRVFLTGERTAWVILLTDLNSRIPVEITPGNLQAIMAGDNTPAPSLETVSQPDKLHDGDQVVTSGDGGLLPPGLPVGVLVVHDGSYRVALFADAATSDEVRVVDFTVPREMPPAATPDDLPAAALPAPEQGNQGQADDTPQTPLGTRQPQEQAATGGPAVSAPKTGTSSPAHPEAALSIRNSLVPAPHAPASVPVAPPPGRASATVPATSFTGTRGDGGLR